MAFLTPLAFIAAFLTIPILLLYMLRLRRREVVISSTFLWGQVLQDREANTPWQKLRRNLLLFLQLLILALLVFALARPFITVPTISGGQTALLIDASASMNAADSAEGTRFDEAKRRALEIVDTLSAGSTLTVIRVASAPEVAAPYTADTAVLRSAINAMQPSQSSADWSAALTLAAAGGIGAADFNVVILSDGNLGTAAQLPVIPGDLRYIPIGSSGDNLAITALATRSLDTQSPQLFAQVTNYSTLDADVVFSLRVDGELFESDRYTIPAGANVPITSDALPDGFTTIEAALTRPVNSTFIDYLSVDDSAWTVSGDTGIRRVLLVSPGNLFLEQVLRSLPGVQVFVGDPARGLPAGNFDVYVFDSYLPTTLPNADMLIVNPPRSTALFTVGAETTAVGNIRVDATDPRMAFVDFSSVNLRAFKPVEATWAQNLIEADGGALLLAGEVVASQVAIITFNLSDSDLPLQITFPVLIAALLESFTPSSALIDADGLRVGGTLSLTLQGAVDSARVRLPDGSTVDLPGAGSVRTFTDTDTPGLYTLELRAGETVTNTVPFAVNLFDTGESRIAPQSTLTLDDTTISQAVEEQLGQQEFWTWLALAALFVLLIEWFAYHRRMNVPTLFRPLLKPQSLSPSR